jgi:hypothetical protein
VVGRAAQAPPGAAAAPASPPPGTNTSGKPEMSINCLTKGRGSTAITSPASPESRYTESRRALKTSFSSSGVAYRNT